MFKRFLRTAILFGGIHLAAFYLSYALLDLFVSHSLSEVAQSHFGQRAFSFLLWTNLVTSFPGVSALDYIVIEGPYSVYNPVLMHLIMILNSALWGASLSLVWMVLRDILYVHTRKFK
jgi:hypothetical protein